MRLLARHSSRNGLKKISLIVESNPTWDDLSEEWGKPIELYPEKRSS
jgi:hypothetical protein